MSYKVDNIIVYNGHKMFQLIPNLYLVYSLYITPARHLLNSIINLPICVWGLNCQKLVVVRADKIVTRSINRNLANRDMMISI